MFLRIIGLLFVAAALQGCSAIKYVYGNVQHLGYWYIDGYADFNEDQEPLVKDAIARVHQWHRTQELARIVETLQRAEKLATGEITADQMCGLVGELRASVERLSERAEPEIVAIARELKQPQFTHIEQKQARANTEYRKDWIAISATERFEKRTKQLVERSEMIYGDLDERQRALVRQQVERSSFDVRAADAERRRRQQDTLATLKQLSARQMSAEQARPLVKAYFNRMLDSPDPAHREYQKKLMREFCQGLAASHNVTTAQQRQVAVRRLQNYQTSLRELSGQK